MICRRTILRCSEGEKGGERRMGGGGMKCEKRGCAKVFRARFNTEALKEREERRISKGSRSYVS